MGATYILYNRLAHSGMCEKDANDILEYVNGNAEIINVTGMDIKAFCETLDSSDKVILCGGDGTLNNFANSLYGVDLDFDIYFWRSGTGNDFLNDIEPAADEKLVRINDYITSLPEISFKDKTLRYLNGVGLGLDGMVCECINRMKLSGKKSVNYALEAAKILLFKYKPCNAEITVDGVTKRYKRIWIAPVMNGRFYGGGIKIAPDQSRFGQTLSCIVVHSASKLTAAMSFPKIFEGDHVKLKIVEVLQGESITVKYDIATDLQVDGDTYRGISSFCATKKVKIEAKTK